MSKSDERRSQLIEIGIRAFSDHGFGGVSIGSIAREAGIANGLLYYYFPGKREFFVAVVREISERMEAATDADSTLPPEEQLYVGLRANLEFAERHAGAFRTILRGSGSGDPEVQEIVELRRRRGVQRVLDGLGVSNPRPALVIAIRGWIGYFEESVLAWLETQALTRDELLQLLLDALRAALRGARAVDSAIALRREALA